MVMVLVVAKECVGSEGSVGSVDSVGSEGRKAKEDGSRVGCARMSEEWDEWCHARDEGGAKRRPRCFCVAAAAAAAAVPLVSSRVCRPSSLTSVFHCTPL